MQQTYWRQIDHIIGPATKDQFGQLGQQNTRDRIEEFVLAHSTESTRLLDAGCNTGAEGYRLFQKRFPGTYVGLDSNPKALVYAMVNLSGFPASVTLADVADLPFADRSFDIVLSKDVIEHAEHYTPIIRELARVTRTYLVLSMFIRMYDQPDHIFREPQGFHHNRYNRAGLYALMQDCGFGPPRIIYDCPEIRHGQFQDEVLVFRRES